MDNKPKELTYDKEVIRLMLSGLEKVFLPVSSTLGSMGRNVLIQLNWGEPLVVHDGVTVAKNIILEDPRENAAAQSIILAAQKTNNEAGDGTTTATILTYAIAKEALEVVSAGINPAPLRKGINKATAAVLEELKRIKKPVTTLEEMIQVATVSSTDPILGELIAKAVQKVGEQGVTIVQENEYSSTVEVQYKEGMEIEHGYISYHMMTNQNGEAIYEKAKKSDEGKPYILMVNERLANDDLIFLLDALYKTDPQARVLMIADDYAPDTVETIILSRMQAGKPFIAIKSPDFGEHRTNLLEDLATLTGGKVVGGASGVPVTTDQATAVTYFGRCDKVTATKDQTIILVGKENEAAINERAAGLKEAKEKAKTDGEKDKFEKRLSKLTGSVAVISVGADGKQEMRELKEKVYDAVQSTKNAVAEGIVPGGGVALIRAGKVIDSLDLKGHEKTGAEIVKKAIEYPMRKLVENAGSNDPGFVVGWIKQLENENIGYNVNTEEFEDMMKSGIIDPVKVTRAALTNATSTAIMLMTASCMITRIVEKKPQVTLDTDGIGFMP